MNSENPGTERPASFMVVDKPPRPVAQARYMPKVMHVIKLVEQGCPVSRACRETELSNSTLYATMKRYSGIKAAYDHAQTWACDTLVDALLDIYDHPVYGKGDARDRKIASENIKWILAKKNPARFGSRPRNGAAANAEKAGQITEALRRAKKRARMIE